ncbi:MAG: CehA/McbA family metallohydrolase [Eubacteriales bacterium]|nr:CehA/McbA family metallohydrolase [Eubacteriales bacterium]
MERQWYKGDTHLHTLLSDGKHTKGQLVEMCKDKGLDFMIITDHNNNSVEESYYDGDILVIQGQELTEYPGHVNVWGKKVPDEPSFTLRTAEDYAEVIQRCKDAGAVVSVNHPFCSNCPFRLNLEDYDFDCVEVWNTIQHSDNMKNRDWWVGQLLKGKHIGAVGGSDFHDNRYGMPLLAMPMTVVYAESNTADDILSAIKEGRSVVTNDTKSSMIYLTCGDANVGDTVKLSDSQKAELKVTNLKKGHKITVYNNEKVIYEHTASKNSPTFMTSFDIEEAGFIRAEITYKFTPLIKKVYTAVESKFLHGDGNVPDFIWAFTNPIWVEE